uniref:Lipoyl-binding domain-containing protein n=1 Tax=Glossina brevipalpis TaxID=37001 RepID=A0A1A9WGX5_9MUSC
MSRSVLQSLARNVCSLGRQTAYRHEAQTKTLVNQCCKFSVRSINDASAAKVLRIYGQHKIHTSAGLWSAETVNVPPFADSITEGDAKFLMKVGEAVKTDQVVAEVETDKTSVPVPSPCNGTIKEFHVNEGDTVKPGQALYTIEKS